MSVEQIKVRPYLIVRNNIHDATSGNNIVWRLVSSRIKIYQEHVVHGIHAVQQG
jgi:hypothetical protein